MKLVSPFALALAGFAASAADLRVSPDMEGGSAKVESLDQAARVVRFKPDGGLQHGYPLSSRPLAAEVPPSK